MVLKQLLQFIIPLRVLLFSKINDYLLESQRYTWKSKLKSCGKDCHLYVPFYIEGAANVEVGDNVSIGTYVHMWGQGGIKIGNRVMIASHTAITSLTHDYNQESMHKTYVNERVTIEDDVWIGAHSVILPGIKIGRGAVVGAGSIVTKNVEPYSVVFGCPAKHYKHREIYKKEIVDCIH